MSESKPTLDCRAAMRQLYDYLDGELSDQARQQVRVHLDSCRECFAHASFERDLLDLISKGWQDLKAPATLVQRIRKQIKDQEGLTS
ncbi:MAG: zf-HC2 domain-containing protein [Longimicrobiales bacterium]